MKRKNGFTLIELLAVIVILAIIALIATPIVLDIINDSRDNSFKSSIDSVKRAIELKISEEQLDGKAEYPYIMDVKDLNLNNKDNLKGKIIINSGEDVVINVNDGTNYYNGEEILPEAAYIKTKVVDGKGKNIVIDNIRNYIYGFDESWMYFFVYEEFEPSKYLEAVNGTVEIEGNEYGTYSTGAKVILKDKNGDVVKEYYIIIFGDIDGDMIVDTSDYSNCEFIKYTETVYEHYQEYAITGIDDCIWMNEFSAGPEDFEYELNQFTRKLQLIDFSLYE